MKNKFLKLIFISLFISSLISQSEKKEQKLIKLNFKDVELKNFFRLIGEIYGVNIVVDEKVKETITLNISSFDLENLLNFILEEKGLIIKKYEDIWYVTYKLPQLEKIKTELIKLKCISANDAIKFITPFLSPIGKIAVFTETISSGWVSTGISSTYEKKGEKERIKGQVEEKPSYLLIEDKEESIEKIKNILENIDVEKKKISIEVIFVEMKRDFIKDLGINWTYQSKNYGQSGGIKLDSQTGTISNPSLGFSGLIIGYSDIIGDQVIARLQLLEQEKKARILSNPKISVLSGHQANILVGEKYPIFRTDVMPGTNPPILVESFDHYEPVGVNLLVIPKLIEPDIINLILHPEVTSLGDEVVGSTGLKTKRINTKEIDTVINIKDGNSIVIGGLISKDKQDTFRKVPFFGDIPFVGNLFRRNEKVELETELLIFITPKIIKEERTEEPPEIK